MHDGENENIRKHWRLTLFQLLSNINSAAKQTDIENNDIAQREYKLISEIWQQSKE